MKRNALVVATVVGLVLQVAMVAAGHFTPAISELFAFGGMGFSLLAAFVYAAMTRGPWGSAALGGALAGGLCALIGIGVSYALGDVPASLLALGTLSSAVAGALGGLAGRAVFRASR